MVHDPENTGSRLTAVHPAPFHKGWIDSEGDGVSIAPTLPATTYQIHLKPSRLTPMPDKKPQIEKFREAARELKTDHSDEAFEAVVKKIAKAPKLTAEQIKNLVRKKRQTD